MMLRALLWKDARIAADVLVAGVVLLAGSYLLALLLVYSDSASGFAWSKVIAGGASLTRFSSILICALLGAYAFAREHEEGSALFLTSLPAKKSLILLSKSLIAAALFVSLWLVSLGIMALGLRAMGYDQNTMLLVLEGMLGYVASGVMAFGAAWYASLFMGNPIGAAFASLMALMPVYAAQYAVNRHFNLENPMFFHPLTILFMIAAGVAGVLAGAIAYSRPGGAPHETTRRLRSTPRQSAPESWERIDMIARPSGPLRALAWKDLRLLRTSLLIGIAVLALPYAVALAGSVELGNARAASVVSIMLSALVFSFWSGHLMSAEVASKTREFLACLPASPSNVVGARLVVVLAPTFLASVLNLFVLLTTNSAIPGAIRLGAAMRWTDWPNAPFLVMGLASANDAVFGFAVAWLLSASYRRPAVAIVVGVMAAYVGLAFWAALATLCAEWEAGPTPLQFVCQFSAVIGAITVGLLIAGSVAAAQRA